MATFSSFAAAAASLFSPVLVSGPVDGFDQSCVQPASIPGYEVESSLAADPTGRFLVGGYQQDRTKRGGAVADVIATSDDGGETWTRTLVDGVSECGGGGFEKQTDPTAAIGPDGTAYVGVEGVSTETSDPLSGSIYVLSRPAGEQAFTRVLVDGPREFMDKPVVSADPNRPGRAWVIWSGGGQWVSRTDDGGSSWGAPVQVVPDGPGGQDHHIIPIGGDEVLAVVQYAASGLSRSGELVSYVSRDAGDTWSKQGRIGHYGALGATVDDRIGVRAPPGVFSTAVGGGDKVFVAHSSRDQRGSAIRLISSANGGRKWRRVVLARGRAALVLPTVAASPDGRRVAVVWLTFRPEKGGTKRIKVRWRIARSDNAGRTWAKRPFSRRFDIAEARLGRRGELFVGDYVGLAPIGPGGGFGALLPFGRPLAESGPTDIFYVGP